MADARFEDATEAPLHLVARDAEDLAVLSALVQDAVFPISEMRWQKGQRRFALLGVYGQAIFVDPARKLVMVHLAANATASAGQTSMGRERALLWQGVVGHYGPW
jgi:CubicO group peptidase (beta-lactamase class C family)